MGGDIPLLRLYAFMACTRTTSSFFAFTPVLIYKDRDGVSICSYKDTSTLCVWASAAIGGWCLCCRGLRTWQKYLFPVLNAYHSCGVHTATQTGRWPCWVTVSSAFRSIDRHTAVVRHFCSSPQTQKLAIHEAKPFFEKLLVTFQVKKFFAFAGIHMYITVITESATGFSLNEMNPLHVCLSWISF